MRKLAGKSVAVALADAAADADHTLAQRASFWQRDIFNRSDLSHEAHVRGLADATRHEHGDFGFFDSIDPDRTMGFEHAGNTLGIVLVHLTAIRVKTERLLGQVGHKWLLFIGRNARDIYD